MARILWILRTLHGNDPRAIRARAIMQHLSAEHEIHVLSLDAQTEGSSGIPYGGRRVQGTRLGHWYWRMETTSWSSYSRLRKCWAFLPKCAYRALSSFVFPDSTSLHLESFRSALKALLEEQQFDAVVSSVWPFSGYFLGRTVKGAQPECRWILDIGDPLFGNSARASVSKSRERRMKDLEGSALELADAVIVTNPGTKEHFLTCYGGRIAPGKIRVVPNGTAPPPERAKDAALARSKNGGRWTLVYAGRFYQRLREPYALFEAVRSMRDRGVELLIYGHRSEFITEAEVDGVSIKFEGETSHEKMPAVYENSDVVVFIDNAYGVQTSGKIFELVAARRPVLFIYMNEDSPTLQIAKSYPAAVTCLNRSQDIRSAIDSIIRNYDSIPFDFDIGPFLWTSRAREFSGALALSTVEASGGVG